MLKQTPIAIESYITRSQAWFNPLTVLIVAREKTDFLLVLYKYGNKEKSIDYSHNVYVLCLVSIENSGLTKLFTFSFQRQLFSECFCPYDEFNRIIAPEGQGYVNPTLYRIRSE
jgi:hypothetical protein